MHRHLGWSATRIFCRSNADAERESGLTAVSAVRRALEARVRPNADRPRRCCTTLDDAENGWKLLATRYSLPGNFYIAAPSGASAPRIEYTPITEAPQTTEEAS